MSDFNVRFGSRGSQCFFNPILYHKTHLLRMTTDFRVVNSVSFFFFSSAFYAPHSCKQSFFFACDRSFKNISILLYLCKGSRTQIRLIHFFRVFFFGTQTSYRFTSRNVYKIHESDGKTPFKLFILYRKFRKKLLFQADHILYFFTHIINQTNFLFRPIFFLFSFEFIC